MTLAIHHGGCHCGAVRYSVEIDPTAQAVTCNCSLCARTGALLQFVAPDKFTLEKGEDHLTDYQFNKRVIHHVFCKTCGVRSFARGKGPKGDMVADNVRTLDDADVFAVAAAARQVDGKRF